MKKHHVRALAAALAVANGHDDPKAYAAKVADAYVPPVEDTPPPPKQVNDQIVAGSARPNPPIEGSEELLLGSTSADLKESVKAARKARTDEGEDG